MDETSNNNELFREGLLSSLLSYQTCKSDYVSPDTTETQTLAPLHMRLQKKVDAIPTTMQQKGLSLLEIQVRMKGRKGGMPHVGELAAALRKLGWIRRRQWSDSEDGFRAKWYPNWTNTTRKQGGYENGSIKNLSAQRPS